MEDVELGPELAMLTDTQLDEIESRARARIEIQAIPQREEVLVSLIDNVRKDIPHLVAEVRRLRAENARLRSGGA